MRLIEQQRIFCELVADLIGEAIRQGFTPRFGEAYRTPEQAAWNAEHGTGIAHSLHTSRLAIDLLLDRNGVYLTESVAYRELGLWWERQHGLARWGGHFSRPDGNHFSLEWEGLR